MFLRLLPEEQQENFMIHIVGANVVPPSLREVIKHHKHYVTFHGYLPDDEVSWLLGLSCVLSWR